MDRVVHLILEKSDYSLSSSNSNYLYLLNVTKGFPPSSVGKESSCNAEDPVQFLGWEDPLEKG